MYWNCCSRDIKKVFHTNDGSGSRSQDLSGDLLIILLTDSWGSDITVDTSDMRVRTVKELLNKGFIFRSIPLTSRTLSPKYMTSSLLSVICSWLHIDVSAYLVINTESRCSPITFSVRWSWSEECADTTHHCRHSPIHPRRCQVSLAWILMLKFHPVFSTYPPLKMFIIFSNLAVWRSFNKDFCIFPYSGVRKSACNIITGLIFGSRFTYQQ